MPHADLGGGARGDHGFGAGSGEASGDAVDFERGPRPGAFEHRIAGLAGELRRTNFVLQEIFFIEGQVFPTALFGGRGRRDVVIHAGNLNLAVGVFHFRQQFDQAEYRVGRRAAVHAGVQIARRAAGFDLGIDQAAQTDA